MGTGLCHIFQRTPQKPRIAPHLLTQAAHGNFPFQAVENDEESAVFDPDSERIRIEADDLAGDDDTVEADGEHTRSRRLEPQHCSVPFLNTFLSIKIRLRVYSRCLNLL